MAALAADLGVMRTQEAPDVTEEEWFEQAWAVREEDVYPRLFGPLSEDICVLTPDLFLKTFKQESFDPRWLHYGVFEAAPTDTRSSWLYVSSGLSNAWEDDHPESSGTSGLGMEFVLQTAQREAWAIPRLAHVVAFPILLASGRYPGRDLLDLHDRMPLRSSIAGEASEITWLTVGPLDGFPSSFQLPTGSVDLLAVVGVTEQEAGYGRKHGGATLIELLRQETAYPVTDWRRSSLVGAA